MDEKTDREKERQTISLMDKQINKWTYSEDTDVQTNRHTSIKQIDTLRDNADRVTIRKKDKHTKNKTDR